MCYRPFFLVSITEGSWNDLYLSKIDSFQKTDRVLIIHKKFPFPVMKTKEFNNFLDVATAGNFVFILVRARTVP